MARPVGIPKTGGRKKGVPNGERKDLFQILHDKFPGYNPVAAMAEMANDKKLDDNLRLQAHKEVAKYTFPQLKAIEVNGNMTGVQVIRFIREDAGDTDSPQNASQSAG